MRGIYRPTAAKRLIASLFARILHAYGFVLSQLLRLFPFSTLCDFFCCRSRQGGGAVRVAEPEDVGGVHPASAPVVRRLADAHEPNNLVDGRPRNQCTRRHVLPRQRQRRQSHEADRSGQVLKRVGSL